MSPEEVEGWLNTAESRLAVEQVGWPMGCLPFMVMPLARHAKRKDGRDGTACRPACVQRARASNSVASSWRSQ